MQNEISWCFHDLLNSHLHNIWSKSISYGIRHFLWRHCHVLCNNSLWIAFDSMLLSCYKNCSTDLDAIWNAAIISTFSAEFLTVHSSDISSTHAVVTGWSVTGWLWSEVDFASLTEEWLILKNSCRTFWLWVTSSPPFLCSCLSSWAIVCR